jgi:Uncharacterized protein conserved in bacteria
MSVRNLALGVIILFGGLNGPALAQTNQDADQKALGQKKESVRKQKEGLLPPKEALEQKDSEIAPDAYQPKGADLGSFMLMPKMEVDLARTNNVYSTNYDKVGDFITTYRPEVALNSRFERHSLTSTLRGERKVFHNYDKENVTNGFAQLAGRYDIGERNNLNASVSYTHDHEDRGSPDDVGGLHPTEFHYLAFNGSGTMYTGNLLSTLGFTAVRRDWEDTVTSTGIAPSHLRNRNDYEVVWREGYEFVPSYSLIGEAAYLARRYVHDADQSGYERDSDGIRISAGLGVDVSDLIRGDFLVGWFRHDYSDGRLTDPSGLFVKALFNWTPTRLTTVIPSIERSVEETTATGVAALLHTAVSVTVRHELERNIILTPAFSYSKDEQQGGGLTTSTYDASLRATYLLNRNLYTSLEVRERHKLGNVDGSGFNQTIALLRLGIQY